MTSAGTVLSLAEPSRQGARANRITGPRAREAGEVVRIGMPQLNAGGLSEGWLFRKGGDLHWLALCADCGQSSDELCDAAGGRLYPTFVAVRARYRRPLSSVEENDSFGCEVRLDWRSRGYAHSVVTLANAGQRLELEMLTMLAARSSHSGELRASAPITSAGHASASPAASALLELSKAARQGRRHVDSFASAALERNSVGEAQPLGSVSYTPSPYGDFNGAGLLYFASYVTIVDNAERELAHQLGWRTGAIARRDWALATSTLRRDVFYYANITVGQVVSSCLMSVERTGSVVKTHTRLVRGDDGRRLADVITTKALG